MARPSYLESVAILKERVEIIGDALPDVTRNPRHDDEVLGPSMFRMLIEDVALDGLSLPGLYVGRTELRRVSFKGSDLRLSTFNWSDINDCDFTDADLSEADLRACQFVRCAFTSALMRRADLRRSSFGGCSFTDADLTEAVLHRRPKLLGFIEVTSDKDGPRLSGAQRWAARWSPDAPEPGGG